MFSSENPTLDRRWDGADPGVERHHRRERLRAHRAGLFRRRHRQQAQSASRERAAIRTSSNCLTNSGTITGASSGGTLTIQPTTLPTAALSDISNGDSLTREPTNFGDAGTISVDGTSSSSTTGLITLASGGSLYLDGSFTLAELGKGDQPGATVDFQRTFDKRRMLNVSSGLGQAVLVGGTIEGGTVDGPLDLGLDGVAR